MKAEGQNPYDIKKFEEQREWSLNTTESQVEESSNRESVEGNSKLLKCSTFPELPNDENSKITRNSPKNEFDILTVDRVVPSEIKQDQE